MKNVLVFLKIILLNCGLNAQAAGSSDGTFGTNGKVVTTLTTHNDRAKAITIQKDGKILVCGQTSSSTIQLNPSAQLCRYNVNGTLDNTFGTNGIVTTRSDTAGYYGFAVTTQADNKIIVAGLMNQSLCVMRYNTNGTLDPSFDGDGIAVLKIQGEVSEAQAVVVQTDGKILVAGSKGASNSGNSKAVLVRFNSNGSIDTTFNGVGYAINSLNSNAIEGAYSMLLQSDGKVVICGYSVLFEPTGYNYSSFVIRYNTNGTLDNTFGVAGIATQANTRATAVKILSGGQLLVSGIVYSGVGFNLPSVNAILKYKANGTLDTSFGTNGIVKHNGGSGAYDMALQADAKIILLSSENGIPTQVNRDLVLSRFNANGQLDTTFATKGISTTKNVLGIVDPRMILQPDGKILVCGDVKENTKFNFTVFRFNNVVGTSIHQMDTKKKVSIFPNPCKDNIAFQLEDIDVDKLNVKIIDALGTVVLQNNYCNLEKQLATRVDLDRLPSGLYFIHLESDTIYQTHHFIKR